MAHLQLRRMEEEGDGRTTPPMRETERGDDGQARRARLKDLDGDPAASTTTSSRQVMAANGHSGWRVDWNADISVLHATNG